MKTAKGLFTAKSASAKPVCMCGERGDETYCNFMSFQSSAFASHGGARRGEERHRGNSTHWREKIGQGLIECATRQGGPTSSNPEISMVGDHYIALNRIQS